MSTSPEALARTDDQQDTPSIWAAVREALGGAHGRDFTEGPIGCAIFIPYVEGESFVRQWEGLGGGMKQRVACGELTGRGDG